MGDLESRLIGLLCAIPALVAGLTVHEFAHAWAAHKLGDDTAKRQGRLTLDPLAHLDPVGSLFIVMAAFFGFFIGWAKPVPVDRRNFAHPRRDDALVAIAGPISNLLQVPFWMAAVAVFTFVAARLGARADDLASTLDLFFQALSLGITINLILAAFNMIPIPPLDGHWILGSIVGPPLEALYEQIRPYSFLILYALIFFIPGFLPAVLGPVRQVGLILLDWAMIFGIRLAVG